MAVRVATRGRGVARQAMPGVRVRAPGPTLTDDFSGTANALLGNAVEELVEDATAADRAVARRAVTEATLARQRRAAKGVNLHGTSYQEWREQGDGANASFEEELLSIQGGLTDRQKGLARADLEAQRAIYMARMGALDGERQSRYTLDTFESGLTAIKHDAMGDSPFLIHEDVVGGGLDTAFVDYQVLQLTKHVEAFAESGLIPGDTNAWVAETLRNETSELHEGVLNSLIQEGKLEDAEAYLDRYGEAMTTSGATGRMNTLQKAQTAAETSRVAGEATMRFPLWTGQDPEAMEAEAGELGVSFSTNSGEQRRLGQQWIREQFEAGDGGGHGFDLTEALDRFDKEFDRQEVAWKQQQTDTYKRLLAGAQSRVDPHGHVGPALGWLENQTRYWDVLDETQRIDLLADLSQPTPINTIRWDENERRAREALRSNNPHKLRMLAAELATMPMAEGSKQDIEAAIQAKLDGKDELMVMSNDQSRYVQEQLDQVFLLQNRDPEKKAEAHGDALRFKAHVLEVLRSAQASGERMDMPAFEIEVQRLLQTDVIGGDVLGFARVEEVSLVEDVPIDALQRMHANLSRQGRAASDAVPATAADLHPDDVRDIQEMWLQAKIGGFQWPNVERRAFALDRPFEPPPDVPPPVTGPPTPAPPVVPRYVPEGRLEVPASLLPLYPVTSAGPLWETPNVSPRVPAPSAGLGQAGEQVLREREARRRAQDRMGFTESMEQFRRSRARFRSDG